MTSLQRRDSDPGGSERGFTLVELLVGTVVSMIVLGGAVAMTSQVQTGYRRQIEAAAAEQEGRYALEWIGKLIRKIAVGTVPIQLHATPDSALVLVANQGTPKKPGTTVSVIDMASMKVAATITTGAGAHGVVISRDGSQAFVTNTYANTVSVIDVAERKVIATVPVGKGPNGITMAP